MEAAQKMVATNGRAAEAATNGRAAEAAAAAGGRTMEDLLEDEAQEGEIELVVQGRTIPVRNGSINH
jgi:hypothetical protein